MANFLSPGVNVTEVDLTASIQSGATSTGAFAGIFNWGPGNQIVSISNETNLLNTFGKPDSNNFTHWFSAANFLAYSNDLRVVRALGTDSLNATVDGSGLLIENELDYLENHSDGTDAVSGPFAAKYAGGLGNSLAISLCPSSNAFSQNVTSIAQTSSSITTSNTTVLTSADLRSYIVVGDLISIGTGNNQTAYVEVSSISNTRINVSTAFNKTISSGAAINRRWKYYSSFTDAPATSTYTNNLNGADDELHMVVYDADGLFSGAKNTILEKFAFMSKARDAKTNDGSSNYYKDVVNNRSKYLWWINHPSLSGTSWGNTATNQTYTESTANINYYTDLGAGADGNPTAGNIQTAYDLFANPDSVDVSLLISGDATLATQIALTSLAETRKDALVFLSPLRVNVIDNTGSELTDVLSHRNSLTSSSYAVMDSGWKYQYDKYNDTYRWVPLNADVAGINARTDLERDPWFSPAGSSRGILKNVIKLAWNPTKTDRDSLYVKGINPIVTFPGEGSMLYGDKTMLSRPSAFDHINVRRLFIVLEQDIAKAARTVLFEINDEITRNAFTSMVEPYLRDIKGRRGITDYRVVADTSVNTPEVIDRNEFVANIYIKPARSINYIQLNFVSTRTGVTFDEVIGTNI